MILFLIGFIPGVGPFLAYAGRNPWVRRALDIAAAVLAALIIVIVFAVHERHVGQAKIEAANAAAVQAAKDRDAKAQAAADAQRAADAAANQKSSEELKNAYAATPDGKPSAARLALACERLRHAGKDVSNLPACR